MTAINPVLINLPATVTNFKGVEKPDAEDKPVVQQADFKSALASPMETVGRSQVNFKGVNFFTSRELNILAKGAAYLKLTPDEIKIGKQALLDTTNDFNCNTVSQLMRRVNKSIDAYKAGKGAGTVHEAISEKLYENINKLAPDADAPRISAMADAFSKLL